MQNVFSVVRLTAAHAGQGDVLGLPVGGAPNLEEVAVVSREERPRHAVRRDERCSCRRGDVAGQLGGGASVSARAPADAGAAGRATRPGRATSTTCARASARAARRGRAARPDRATGPGRPTSAPRAAAPRRPARSRRPADSCRPTGSARATDLARAARSFDGSDVAGTSAERHGEAEKKSKTDPAMGQRARHFNSSLLREPVVVTEIGVTPSTANGSLTTPRLALTRRVACVVSPP